MEKQPPANQRPGMMGKLLNYRKTIAGLGVLGGFFVLKSTGCLENDPVKPESKKPALAEQAPAVNQSQQKAREALLAALSQKQEPAEEIEVSDDVGFGGPDPEDEINEALHVSPSAKAFLLLPVGAAEGVLQAYNLENTPLMDYIEALKELRRAIFSEDKEVIQESADKALRLADYLQSEEGMAELGDWKSRFKKGNKKQKKKGKARLKFVIDTFQGSLSYVRAIAGR